MSQLAAGIILSSWFYRTTREYVRFTITFVRQFGTRKISQIYALNAINESKPFREDMNAGLVGWHAPER